MTTLIVLSGFALVGCDDGPEKNVPDKSVGDIGLFVAKVSSNDKSLHTGFGVDRVRLVRLNATVLQAMTDETTSINIKSVRLNLFPDLVVMANIERTPGGTDGPAFFGGQVVGQATSLVTLMLQDGKLTGNIRLDGLLYRVRPDGDGDYRIEKVKPVEIPDHASQPAAPKSP